jgi:beta-galactosidase
MKHIKLVPLANMIILLLLVQLSGFARTPAAVSQSMASAREQLLLDAGWRFHLGDASSPVDDFGYGLETAFGKAGEAPGAAQMDFNDSTWRKLDIPHDWAVELDFVRAKEDNVKDHGFKPVGRQFPKSTIGWYRRTFMIPKSDMGKRLTVKFDGVFRDCVVWFNGHFLGRNLSGYSEFSFDVTNYVLFGKKNVLVVRADASQYEGWFYEGAGIYRHVWLLKWNSLHVPLYGTFVWTEVEDPAAGKNARVNIETKLFNQSAVQVKGTLQLTIIDETGKSVASASSEKQNLHGFEEGTIRQSIQVPNPKLWSLESPHLYTIRSEVISEEKLVDRTETSFGIRTIRFDKDSGLYLNGKRVEIQGVCCHQDHAGVGSALPDRLQYYRIERLKEMGCNAYRTSHNPPTSELLDACDRLGMLVMDENRLMGTTPEFRGQFKTQILRDRNHPSVFVWSLGNEEWQIQDNPMGTNIARDLKRLQKELDPSRLCTYAGNNGNHYDGINSVVDVRGINYIVLGDPDKYHRDHPDQPVMGSEEASTLCTRGIYMNDTTSGFVSDYDVNAPGWGSIAEKWWKFYAARPWLAGAFVWTGFDYRGEPTPYSWPCISSHFGILDVCGFPKNNFYYYQSWWTSKTVLHLAPHWNWRGKEGQSIDVWCQSNCDSVELFLNGKSLGRKVMERNSHLEWKVPYEAGTLEARGWRNGKKVSTKVETTDDPVTIVLTPDRQSIHADGEDVCVVNVTALDGHGREVPVADNLIRFEVNGGGRIIGVGNGNPSSHEPDKYLDGNYQRKLFNGKCQVIVQAGREASGIELQASSDGLKLAKVIIKAEESPARPSVEQ